MEYTYGTRVELTCTGSRQMDGKTGIIVQAPNAYTDKAIILLDEEFEFASGVGRAVYIGTYCLNKIDCCVTCRVCGREEIDHNALTNMYIDGWVRHGEDTFLCQECEKNGPKPDSITIPLNEYNELVDYATKLSCLEAMGVDNWSGYDEAMEMYRGD